MAKLAACYPAENIWFGLNLPLIDTQRTRRPGDVSKKLRCFIQRCFDQNILEKISCFFVIFISHLCPMEVIGLS